MVCIYGFPLSRTISHVLIVVSFWAIHYVFPFLDDVGSNTNSLYICNVAIGILQILTLFGAQPIFLVDNSLLVKILASMWVVNLSIFCTDMDTIYANLSIVATFLSVLYVIPFSRCGVSNPLRLSVIVPFILIAGVYSSGEDTGGLKLPMFNGLKTQWSLWFMSFGAFLAAKYQTEHALFLSCEKTPPAIPSKVTTENAEQVKILSAANAAWLEADSKLYGLILLAMPAHLKTHLNAHSPYKGTLSMLRLKARFNVSDASDRKGAIANVSKSYIDTRATISTKDITRQYD